MPSKYSYICSDHFLISGTPKRRQSLNSNSKIEKKLDTKFKKQKKDREIYDDQSAKKRKSNSPSKRKLKKQVKSLQQKIRRRDKKLRSLKDILATF